MKHVMPNETEQLLDLGKPSLEALSFMLRHREMWPAGFKWNYAHCETCAMGLAYDLWDESQRGNICTFLDVPSNPAGAIFGDVGAKRGLSDHLVNPEMVADDIDVYLASRS